MDPLDAWSTALFWAVIGAGATVIILALITTLALCIAAKRGDELRGSRKQRR